MADPTTTDGIPALASQGRRVSSVDAAVTWFIERLEDGTWSPGAKLPCERELQPMIGYSRIVLREAMARLAALGLIRIEHGRGSFVQERPSHEAIAHALRACFPTRNPQHFRDFVEARLVIEREVTVLAARNRTDEDIAHLHQLLDRQRAAKRDPAAFAEADLAFHIAIADIAGNVFFQMMIRALATHMHEFLTRNSASAHNRKWAIIGHERILQAIVDRDEEEASALTRANIEYMLRRLPT